MPTEITSTPTAQKPDVKAASSISPEALVSLPIITFGLLSSSLFFIRISAAAIPIFIASSFVKSLFAIPLTPSVPNNLPTDKSSKQTYKSDC